MNIFEINSLNTRNFLEYINKRRFVVPYFLYYENLKFYTTIFFPKFAENNEIRNTFYRNLKICDIFLVSIYF